MDDNRDGELCVGTIREGSSFRSLMVYGKGKALKKVQDLLSDAEAMTIQSERASVYTWSVTQCAVSYLKNNLEKLEAAGDEIFSIMNSSSDMLNITIVSRKKK